MSNVCLVAPTGPSRPAGKGRQPLLSGRCAAWVRLSGRGLTRQGEALNSGRSSEGEGHSPRILGAVRRVDKDRSSRDD